MMAAQRSLFMPLAILSLPLFVNAVIRLRDTSQCDFVCTVDGLYGDPCDCSKYHQCHAGRDYVYTCATGTLFNDQLKICDWAANVQCHSTTDPATTQPPTQPITTQPVTEPSTSNPTTAQCTNKKDYVRVCYYSNWAYWRTGNGQYTVDDINLDLCTHVIYAFAVLDDTTYTIKAHDAWLDLPSSEQGGSLDNFNKFTNLKNKKPGVKMLLALGGWNDSRLSLKYSYLVASSSSRKAFITHAISFLKNYGFDGLDLDWEYPSDAPYGRPEDKINFGVFVKELKTSFEPHGFLLTAAVGASERLSNDGYDIPSLSENLDYIHLMTYDFHGSWESTADHHSKLYNDATDTVNRWIEKGASRDKLVLGFPAYGRSFTLSSSKYTPPAPASRGGDPGSILGEMGYLSYLEILGMIHSGYNVQKDTTGSVGTYIYSGNQWAGYDDVDTVKMKSNYVKNEGLAGIMVWAIDLEDFRGSHSPDRYPLLEAAKSTLLKSDTCETSTKPSTEATITSSLTEPPTTQPITTQPVTEPSTSIPTTAQCTNKKDYVRVCYYSNWAYWRTGNGQYTVDDINLDLCTHVIYAFAVLDDTTYTIKAHDAWLDLPSSEQGGSLDNFNKFTNLKNKKPGVKMLLALGGWNDSRLSLKYSYLVASSSSRKAFITHAISFLKNYGFDGLDLDWEYPSDAPYGRPEDKINFGVFVKELKTSFEPHGFLLTAAVGASERLSNDGYDIPSLSENLDYIHLMTYDFHGSWESTADHHSKLYNDATDTVNRWIEKGASRDKLVLGFPAYGRSFTLSSSKYTPPAPASRGGDPGPILGETGYLSYLEILGMIHSGYNVQKDTTGSVGTYIYSGNQWAGYDDVDTVKMKSNYVKNEGLAGIMVWAIDLEDFRGSHSPDRYPLLEAAKSTLLKSDTCETSTKPSTEATITSSFTSKPTTDISTCSEDYECPGNGLWPDPCDCQKYYNCFGGSAQHLTCTDGTLFSQEKGLCDWAANVQCHSTTDPATTQPPTQPITTQPVTEPSTSNPTTAQCTNKKDYVRVCYYSNWAYWRTGNGQYTVEDIDLDLCTHVIYAFAVLDDTTYTIKAHDAWLDLPSSEQGGSLDNFNKFTNLKNKKPGVKMLLALGGWNDSRLSLKYSYLVASSSSRKAFITHAISFLKNYGFDGLDLDWEYPSDAPYGRPEDKINFGVFVKELKTSFEPHGFLLTAAVGASERLSNDGYDIPSLSENLDYIHLMTYDFHGSWESTADHHSKLYNDATDTVNRWIEKGASRDKLVLGFPAYGRSFTLSSSKYTPPAPASRGGDPGPILGQTGYLSYLEILGMIHSGYNIQKDTTGSVGTYIYSGNQWAGYDDVDTVKMKSNYVKNEGLAGIMVWAIDLEDFRGSHSPGRYPLLEAAKSTLLKSDTCETSTKPSTEATITSSLTEPPTTQPITTQPVTEPSTSIPTTAQCTNKKDYVRVCYYSNWAYWRTGNGQYTVDDINLHLCTHVIYAFAVLDDTTYTIKAHDAWLDLPSSEQGGSLDNFNKFTNLKNKKPGVKMLLALGGWNDSRLSLKYSYLVASSSSRKAFITHAISFLKNYGFDGLDLDWEYPSDAPYGRPEDKINFGVFVKELKTSFEPHGFLLTAAVGASERLSNDGYDIPSLSEYLDYIHLMTYDFHGSWESTADHHSKLYNDATDTVNRWIEKGASRDKLVLGFPAYGRSFTLNSSKYTPPAPASRGGDPGPILGETGYLSYLEILGMIHSGYNIQKDTTGSVGTYIYSGNQWAGYDDVDTVKMKSNYVKNEGLAGIMVWAIDLEDFRGSHSPDRYPLLEAAKSTLLKFDTCETSTKPSTEATITSSLTEPPTTQPITTQPVTEPSTSIPTTAQCTNKKDYVRVCYYSNWAYWRTGNGQYTVDDINLDLCTHVIYAFAVLDDTTYTIKAHDAWLDLPSSEQGGSLDNFNKFTNLKNKKPGVKMLLALGGWNDSRLSLKYSYLVASSSSRKAFITHAISFLKNYGFDGLDLDWEYPSDAPYGRPEDKINFGVFVKELKTSFEPHGFLLTAAVGASERLSNDGYDIPSLSENLDYIHLMTYDFHGSWESTADHHSKLYNDATDTVNRWIEKGASRDKLVLGFPAYGRSFTLSSSKYTPPAPASKGGNPGPILGETGYLSYLEILGMIHSGYNVQKDTTGSVGTYIYSGNQWAGYDDVDTVKMKSNYVKNEGLAGIMVWAIDLEDFRGSHSPDRYPLLEAAKSTLLKSDTCETSTKPSTEATITSSFTSKPTTDISTCSEDYECPGNGLWPDPCDCQKYYNCFGGSAQHLTCTDGTLFSQEKGLCDWAANVQCHSTTDPATTQPPTQPITTQPVTEPSTSNPTTAQCTNKKDYVRVCYYSNWAYWRTGNGQYTVEDIDLDLCTHVIYAFAVLDDTTYTIKAHDAWLDLPSSEQGGSLDNFNKFTNLKNKKPGVKMLLALGGWNDSRLSLKYSYLVASSSSRKAFITHAISFLKNYGFDGLDLDWEYPSDAPYGRPEDKINFGVFVKELKTSFEPHGFLLTAAVGASERLSNDGYDIPSLSENLDYIHLMTYDFHGSWESTADHHSKLYNDATDTVNRWIEKGASRDKLVLGFPAYGRSFTLSSSKYTPPAPASRGGDPGPILGETGYLSYLEILGMIHSGYNIQKDTTGSVGTYIYSGNQWAGYDDVDTVKMKSNYVKNEGLAGIMVWAIDLEDFRGSHSPDRYPLLEAAKSTLLKSDTCETSTKSSTEATITSSLTEPPTTQPITTQPVTEPSTSIPTTAQCTNKKNYVRVCYYSNWAYWRTGNGQYTVDDINLDLCTHVIYAFAVLDDTTYTIKAHDAWLDLPSSEQGGSLDNFNKFTNLKNKKPGVKMLLALGGWNDSRLSLKYSYLVASSSSRKAFITHAISFLKNYGFDGLDLDWEYPSDAPYGRPEDKINFGVFVKELKTSFEPHGFLLTAAVGASERLSNDGYDVPTLSENLDYIHLMTYDFHGSWESTADHHSKLYNDATDTVNRWIEKGASRDKLVLGFPAYGRSFTLSSSKYTPPAPASRGGDPGPILGETGYLSYLEILGMIHSGYNVQKDTTGSVGTYIYSGNQWAGYDDVDTVKMKSNYVKNEGLAGIMVWAIDLEDFRGSHSPDRYPLLEAAKSTLLKSDTCETSTKPSTEATITSSFTSKPTTDISTCSEDYECPGNGLWPDPCDCQKYYNCFGGSAQHLTCADGTLFSQEKGLCDWAANVQCHSTTDPATTQPPTQPITTQPVTKPSTSNPTTAQCTNKKDYVRVCYYSNWAYWRTGNGQYTVEDIDLDLCTHVIYAFAVLDDSTYTIKAHDAWLDLPSSEQGGSLDNFNKFTNLKNKKPGVKMLLALGGWNDSRLSLKYSYLVASSSSRKAFITHAISFLKNYGFDGLDLDWEYPSDAPYGRPEDKINFGVFVKELKTSFEPHGFLLTAAVGASERLSNDGYDIPTLSENLDYIHLMTYDFHGSWESTADHHSKLYNDATDTVNRWIEKGASRDKLVLGFPAYGRSFTLSSSKYTPPAPASRGGDPGPILGETGYLSYLEILGMIHSGYNVQKDTTGSVGTYIYSGNQWAGYDDVDTVKMKSNYVKNEGLAGIMVWAIDLEDFRGSHSPDRYPLLEAAKSTLLKSDTCETSTKSSTEATITSSLTEPPTTQPITTQPVTEPSTSIPTTAQCTNKKDYVRVCYYSNWAYWRTGNGQYTVDDINLDLCTHVIYAFAVLDDTTYTIKAHDAWLDLPSSEQGGSLDNFNKFTNLKNKKPGVKMLLALGGWNDSRLSLKYSYLVASSSSRKAFITHAISFLKNYGFDGLDLDWEYPSDAPYGRPEDKINFGVFVKELKTSFEPHGFLLTAAVGASERLSNDGYDIPTLSENLDYIHLMTYDFHGSWESTADHHSKLYNDATDTVNRWIEKGASRDKLVLGFPAYGWSFTLSSSKYTPPAPASRGGDPGPILGQTGYLSYLEILGMIHSGYNVQKDTTGSVGTYIYSGNQWAGYDDVDTVKMKSNYVKNEGLAGIMVWAIDLEDFLGSHSPDRYPLLEAAKSTLLKSDTCETSTKPSTEATITSSLTEPPTTQPITTQSVTEPSTSIPTTAQCTNKKDYVRVCYYSNWAYWRTGNGQFTVEDINLDLCTHVIYAFAVLDDNTYTMKAHDAWLDLPSSEQGGSLDNFNKFTNLKNKKPGVKMLLALGGWTDSRLSLKYSYLVESSSRRKAFITHAISFLKNYGFDGLDLDWEYPSDAPYGRPQDKINFGVFVKELKTSFEPHGFLLTAAVGASERLSNDGYDVPTLSENLDYIHLMTYDFHGSWESTADHHSKLYNDATDTVNRWIEKGASRDKLVLGFPAYGRSFTLSSSKYTPPTPASRGGDPGPILGQTGYLSYLEILGMIHSGYNVQKDTTGSVGTYIYFGNQWAGYDDVDTVKMKSNYVKNEGLAGIMVWAIDLEDFRGSHSPDRYPLLEAAKSTLLKSDTCETSTKPSTEATITSSLTEPPTTQPITTQPPTTQPPTTQPPTTQPPTTQPPTTEPQTTQPPTTQPPTTQPPTTEPPTTQPPTTQPPTTQPPTTQPPTTQPPTTQPPTTQPPTEPSTFSPTTNVPACPGKFECPGDGLWADPCDCQKYYNCHAGIPYHLTCAGGTLFSQDLENCDWDYNVDCNTEGQTTTKNLPPTTTSEPVCDFEFACGKNGRWADPCNCQKYYKCSDSGVEHLSCPDGTLWFQTRKRCRKADENLCNAASIPTCNGGVVYACSSHSRTIHMQCSDGTSASFECPMNLAWSSDLMKCISFADPQAQC